MPEYVLVLFGVRTIRYQVLECSVTDVYSVRVDVSFRALDFRTRRHLTSLACIPFRCGGLCSRYDRCRGYTTIWLNLFRCGTPYGQGYLLRGCRPTADLRAGFGFPGRPLHSPQEQRAARAKPPCTRHPGFQRVYWI